MVTMKGVRDRVKALGANVEVLRKSPLDMQVLAPVGHVFEGGLHILVGHDVVGEAPERVYADLLQRMEHGVAPCEDENCDCREEDDDEDEDERGCNYCLGAYEACPACFQ